MIRLLAAILMLIAAAGEARAQAWHRAETRHFTLQAELPADEVRQLARELEALNAALMTMTGASEAARGRKLDILMVDDIATLRKLTTADDLTEALFFNNAIDQAAIVARADKRRRAAYDMREALFHEYCHYFLRRYLPGIYPSWYNEGFASVFESARITGGTRVRIGEIPRVALWLDPAALTPFARIASVENALEMTKDRDKLYAQGWLIAHHSLFGGKRAAEVKRYLDLVRSGRPLGKPELLFAGGYAGFDADIAAYAAADLPPPRDIAVPHVPDAEIAVRELRPGEVALLERRVDDAELDGAWAGEDASQFLLAYASANNKLGKWPDDPALALYTAKLAFLAGRSIRATELVDPLIAKSPGDLDILALKGRVLVLSAQAAHGTPTATSRLAESRKLLMGVLARDASHVDALAGMNENLTEARGANVEAIGYLRRAIDLEPSNTTMRYRAIGQMLRIGDYRGAIAMLQPLANAPHDGSSRQFALELIAEIRRRSGIR
ncbi:hypothetical protein ACFQ1E_10160 [Sphingomonas canadensis]|uniref:DUF1570 domain-containing protein n=1 Tax=Sphingomonas canadensis TaxID=1219257 RepID=A0ABW3HB71_9SPHN|nr:hypothetical protein [Sphingomonas canadensis]MCW3836517.1 hypothetical protein [Sphingomonas canadensis]